MQELKEKKRNIQLEMQKELEGIEEEIHELKKFMNCLKIDEFIYRRNKLFMRFKSLISTFFENFRVS